MAALNGMVEITEYYGYSASTVRTLIKTRGFPAVKLSGGSWTSDTDLIDKWRRQQIVAGSGKALKGDCGAQNE